MLVVSSGHAAVSLRIHGIPVIFFVMQPRLPIVLGRPYIGLQSVVTPLPRYENWSRFQAWVLLGSSRHIALMLILAILMAGGDVGIGGSTLSGVSFLRAAGSWCLGLLFGPQDQLKVISVPDTKHKLGLLITLLTTKLIGCILEAEYLP